MVKKEWKALFLVFFIILNTAQLNAFWGAAVKGLSALSKSSKALPTNEIVRLSKLSDNVYGTRKVGKELAKLNLPDDVLEDTFMRIAIYQRKISRERAEEMFLRLSGTPGFRTTLRKVIGNNSVGTAGHLNELKIAESASVNGFKVIGIGKKFTDGLKKAPTDIDVLLKKGNKVFAIEAKSYASTTKIPLDKFRADLDTLLAYKKIHGDNIIPVFTITNQPSDSNYLKMLQYEAKKRGVQLIFGEPKGQIEQIKILGEIL